MNPHQANLEDLNKVVDAVLVKMYGSGNLVNGFSATTILRENNMSLDPGFVDIVVDKLKGLPYWIYHEVTSTISSDLIINHNAAGYDFYREHGLYTDYLRVKEARTKLLDKAVIDSASATVDAARSAGLSTKIARWSLIWAFVTTGFTIFQFFTIQSNRQEIDKLKKEFEKPGQSQPSQKVRPIEKQKTPSSVGPAYHKK